MGLIALISDFGETDWFVGEMKGAMLKVAPNATIIDITHHIIPGDIRTAAFMLLSCYRTFPAGTVFCVVVDPGVGSPRAAIAVRSDQFFFVAPNNGVLSWALAREGTYLRRTIDCPALLPGTNSSTFHGRDIFGPVAAHLSEKIEYEKIGPPLQKIVDLPWPAPVAEKELLTGTVIHIDRFGNAITTIDQSIVKVLQAPPQKIRIPKYGTELPYCSYFQQVPSGQGLAYLGSAGFVEIAINKANAAAVFGLRIGDTVEIS